MKLLDYFRPQTWVNWYDDNKEVVWVLGVCAAGLIAAFVLGAVIY